VDAVAPQFLVVDSVQTMASPDVAGVPGGVTQIRQVAGALIQIAKERGIATVLVGHVTKDGSIAGPRLLEHLVDVVLHFEGERHSQLRLLRAVKNRYGPTDEIGCFELTEFGLMGLPDPSGLFLTGRTDPVPGTCISVTLEGRRPLITEVHALVAPTPLPAPRRATSGLDTSRVNMILAVLEKRNRMRLANMDVYASTVGGVRLNEPATDLALAIAVGSSHNDVALPVGLVAIGEVGLAGVVRTVRGLRRRVAEAQRLGFTHALVPKPCGDPVRGVRTHQVEDLSEALVHVSTRRAQGRDGKRPGAVGRCSAHSRDRTRSGRAPQKSKTAPLASLSLQELPKVSSYSSAPSTSTETGLYSIVHMPCSAGISSIDPASSIIAQASSARGWVPPAESQSKLTCRYSPASV